MNMANVGILFFPANIQLNLIQVVFERLYPKDYTSGVATRVSNSLLVGVYIFSVVLCQYLPLF